MLTCQQIATLLTDYLEGRLSFWDRMALRLHLGMCTSCRAYLRQLKLTIGTTRQIDPGEVPPDVMEALIQRFRGWNR